MTRRTPRPTGPALAIIVVFAALGSCRSRGAGTTPGPAAGAQPPPAVRHDERVFAGGAIPPAEPFVNPYAGDTAAAAAGAQLFTAMNCDGCHGGGATGWVGPSLADGRWRYGGSDAEVFQSIYYGRPHGMPAFGGLVPRAGIWKIVTYVESLAPPHDVATESWTK